MPTSLNSRRHLVIGAVALISLAWANQPLARAQDDNSKNTVDQPETTPDSDDSASKSDASASKADAASNDKPATDPTEKPADKKDADKKDAEKKDPGKKDSEIKDTDKKDIDKNGAEKHQADKKDADSKETEKKDSSRSEPPAKTPRRITGLGSFDGVQLRNQPWRIHDIRRPHPPVVTPGELSTYDKPGTAPSDAIVLFDGKDLSQWAHLAKDTPDELVEAQWKVQDGYFEITPGFGSLQTLEGFGSCHLHIEWQSPAQVRGEGQHRGNSGVKFMSSFEVQILDSFNNRTYADGQAGAIYGQYPPMVNAARKPGEWQVYDILFIAPKFSLDGDLQRPASATVMHNGIFVQNAREYAGPSGAQGAMYSPLTPAAPIMLQDHGSPVRFRNIWVRTIPDSE